MVITDKEAYSFFSNAILKFKVANQETGQVDAKETLETQKGLMDWLEGKVKPGDRKPGNRAQRRASKKKTKKAAKKKRK